MSRGPNKVRVVLPPELQREVLEQWAARLGFELRYESERSGSELRGRTWTVDETTEVSFFEDHFLGVYVLHATGDHAEQAVRALREVVAFRELDEVLDEAERASDPASKISALGAAVRAVNPEVTHERLLALLKARLEEPNPSVRRAALVALGMLDWPEIDPMLGAFEADPVLGPGVRLRRWAKARSLADGTGEFETQNIDILISRAEGAIAASAWARASRSIEKLLDLSVVRERAYALRARVRRAEGRPYLAYADALTATALGGRHNVNVDDARALAAELADELSREGPTSSSPDDLTTNLAVLLGVGRRADVEEIATGLLAVPTGQEARIRVHQSLAAYEEGREYARTGRRKEALRDLARAVELDRKWAEKAREDEYFKSLWKDPAFKRITGRG
jgi:tetratricopeptide (TPR) repeat protein